MKNGMCRIRRILIFLLISIAFPVFAISLKTVRIGYYPLDCCQMEDVSGRKSGFGYEYLQHMARYTNWQYEYYRGSWADCLDKLADGKIDLMISVAKTPELEKKYDYSDKPVSLNHIVLIIKAQNNAIKTGEYEKYGKARVGLIKRWYGNQFFFEMAKNKGFYTEETDPVKIQQAVRNNCIEHGESLYKNAVWFDTADEMTDALLSGKIDICVGEDVVHKRSDEQELDNIDDSFGYVIVRKGNKELIAEVNEALMQIEEFTPGLSIELYKKYYIDFSMRHLILEADESAYVESLRKSGIKIKVAALPDIYPFSAIRNRVPEGVVYDMLTRIADQTGIRFEILQCTSRNEFNRLQKNHEIQVCLTNTMNNYSAEQTGYKLTEPYYTSSLSRIYLDGNTSFVRAAALNNSNVTDDFVRKKFPASDIYFFDTVQECLDAIRNDTADVMYMRTEEVNCLQLDYYLKKLKSEPVVGYSWNLQFGILRDTDPALYSILNKFICFETETTVSDLVNRYTALCRIHPFSWRAFAYRNPLKALVLITFVFFLILVIMFMYNRLRKFRAERDYTLRLETALKKEELANSAKSDFMARMSHDMRTPMNAVIGFSTFGEQETTDSASKKYFSLIKDSSQYLMSLINDVLDMQRLETDKIELMPEPVDMPAFYSEIETMIRTQAVKKNIVFIVETSGEKVAYQNVDRMRLEQILINILNNAVKYTRNNGCIRWQTEYYYDTAGELTVKYTVSDNGVGISREFLEKIFEPFEQEHNEFSREENGTGLGLSIVKKLVAKMKGSVTVSSVKGQGSTFTIILPVDIVSKDAYEAKQKASLVCGTLVAEVDFGNRNILLCEDNELNAIIVGKLLESKGIHVEYAKDGVEGLNKFMHCTPGYYSLILMDIRMPIMDGLEATKAIRRLDRPDAISVPIVAQSANAMENDIKESQAAGMNDYIVKPIDPDKLFAIMAKLMKTVP